MRKITYRIREKYKLFLIRRKLINKRVSNDYKYTGKDLRSDVEKNLPVIHLINEDLNCSTSIVFEAIKKGYVYRKYIQGLIKEWINKTYDMSKLNVYSESFNISLTGSGDISEVYGICSNLGWKIIYCPCELRFCQVFTTDCGQRAFVFTDNEDYERPTITIMDFKNKLNITKE